jgi:hypothetical protein
LRKKLIPAAIAGAAVLAAATALPAVAAGTGSTTAVIQLAGGTLDISVPVGPVALASGAVTDTSVSGQLGTVTVTDTRAADPASWTASVSATPFQSGSHSLGAETYDTGVVSSTGIPISQFTITSPVTLSTTPRPWSRSIPPRRATTRPAGTPPSRWPSRRELSRAPMPR